MPGVLRRHEVVFTSVVTKLCSCQRRIYVRDSLAHRYNALFNAQMACRQLRSLNVDSQRGFELHGEVLFQVSGCL